MGAAVHGEITKDGKSVVIVVAGDDWELDAAGGALRHMTPAFARSDPPGALTVPLSWPLVVQFGYTFDGQGEHGSWHPGPKLTRWTRDQAMRRANPNHPATVKAGFASPPFVPEGLTARKYQLEGASEISVGGKFLVLDEPGTGKTVTTILGLKMRGASANDLKLGLGGSLVIVVPAWEVADNWAREIARWAPEWPAPVMYSGPDRLRLLAEAPAILLTTYATARIDAPSVDGPLAKLKARAVVADEFHFMKNVTAQRTQAVARISAHAQTFVGLSGTPVTRDTGDVYPPLSAMDPGAWPSRERFVKRYCDRAEVDYGEVIEGLKREMEPEFRTALMGSMRRVAKADVLDQLPPKVYSVRRVQIPDEWRKAYDTMASQMLAELPDGTELPVMSTLAQITRLIQLASSACDVEPFEVVDQLTGEATTKYAVEPKAPCWKADALLNVVDERSGEPVVCFSRSSKLTYVAAQIAAGEGYRVGTITGDDSRTARKSYLEQFAAGKLDLICATVGAGGTGINELAVAGTAVFLDRDYGLENSIQPEDRLQRIGQSHDCVEIIDIVAADTVDEKVRSKLREKAGQFAEFVKDPRIVRDLLGGIK